MGKPESRSVGIRLFCDLLVLQQALVEHPREQWEAHRYGSRCSLRQNEHQGDVGLIGGLYISI